MRYINYDKYAKTFKYVIAIKEKYFDGDKLEQFYVDPLIENGINPKDILLISLKDYSRTLSKRDGVKELSKLFVLLDKIDTKSIIIADSQYYKIVEDQVTNVKDYGLNILIAIYFVTNYGAIKHNANKANEIYSQLKRFANNNFNPLTYDQCTIRNIYKPTTISEINDHLYELKRYEELSCYVGFARYSSIQIPNKPKILCIAFGTSKDSICAFNVSYGRNCNYEIRNIYKSLKEFFMEYQGELYFFNALEQIKIIIEEIFMQGQYDIDSMKSAFMSLKRSNDVQIWNYLENGHTRYDNIQSGKESLEDIVDAASQILHQKQIYNPAISDQLEVYNEIFRPSIELLIKMMIIGIPILPEQVRMSDRVLQQIIARHMISIKENPIYKLINLELQIREQLKTNSKLAAKHKELGEFSNLVFNLNSFHHKHFILYDLLKLEPIDKNKLGKPSVGTKTLQKLLTKLKLEHGITDSELIG